MPRTKRDDLTDRQREVLRLIAAGKTNASIADKLGISLDGAKYHVSEVMAKLGVDSREAAAELWKAQESMRARFFRRPRVLVPGSVLLKLLGVAGAAVVAVAAASMVILAATRSGDDRKSISPVATASVTEQAALSSTQTLVAGLIMPTAPQPQPALVEAGAGDSWRLLVTEAAVRAFRPDEAILALGFDLSPPRVDVLDPDGRIVARVETGYQPMARINPANGTLVVSDELGSSNGRLGSRVLVFALAPPRFLSEIALPQQRANFTTPANWIAVSPNGHWLYWVEHTRQPDPPSCASGGDESVCDMMVVHAVDLMAGKATGLAASMPRACGVPALAPYRGAAIVAECLPRQGSRWVINAEAPPGEFASAALGVAPAAKWDWSYGRVGDTVLEVSFTSEGSLTRARLRDASNGTIVAEMPLTDTWGAYLLDDRHVLFLRPSGRLDLVDVTTSMGRQLPYAIDPGRQGLDVLLTR